MRFLDSNPILYQNNNPKLLVENGGLDQASLPDDLTTEHQFRVQSLLVQL